MDVADLLVRANLTSAVAGIDQRGQHMVFPLTGDFQIRAGEALPHKAATLEDARAPRLRGM